MSTLKQISMTVNGVPYEGIVEPRMTLVDFLRDELRLSGTHVGCEHGVCGLCNVLLDGQTVRSCLTLAVQADGGKIMTVEGLAEGDGKLHAIQQAFKEEHGLQCGFCTPGFMIAIYELIEKNPSPSEEQIMDVLGGNICRCTGYQSIVRSVHSAIAKLGGLQPTNISGGA
jgi:aerobic-type carbon monoxide dehydrogenase small subunit (CoxS/CutS family)